MHTEINIILHGETNYIFILIVYVIPTWEWKKYICKKKFKKLKVPTMKKNSG